MSISREVQNQSPANCNWPFYITSINSTYLKVPNRKINKMRHKNPLQLFVLICVCVVYAFMAGCSDWYSEPVLLENQKALSEVYAGRPLYSSVFYEGQLSYKGDDVHVFVVMVISKFTSSASYFLYYLPVANMVIETDAGQYEGEDELKLIYLLNYDHDEGQFNLLENKQHVEVIKANFTETYSLKETRCRNAVDEASANPNSYPLTKSVAEICFWSDDFEKSKAFTRKLKDNMGTFDRYTTEGQMLHDYYTIMGRHFLREGQTQEAKTYLLQSIDVKPSPVMTSFGPNMELAMDLLKAGETATVLEYLDGCAKFWKEEPVNIWKQKISEGRMPILNQHSWGGELGEIDP